MKKISIIKFVGIIVILMSTLAYIDLHQSNGVNNINSVKGLPLSIPIKSRDITIDITKNASAIGPNSVIEFSVELTNNLSESLYDISVNVSEISSDLNIVQAIDPLFTESSLDPETSTDFQFVAEYLGNSSSSKVDLVLLIDASGSMQAEIDAVIAELNDLISNLTTEIPDLHLGVIVFGWSKYSQYPMSSPNNYIELTNDYDRIKTFINSLYASGSIEPWGDALYLANSWNWREDASKLIILLGDEDCDPGKIVGLDSNNGFYNGSDLLDVVTDLKNQNIKISTVICGYVDFYTENQFQWIAKYTEGTSVSLPEMELEGITLPDIIEEWTLELGREYYKSINLTVFWRDGSDNNYFNSQIASFWLDLTSPSIIISKTISPSGIGLFSVEFIINVDDVSPIGYATFYHNVYGSWDVEYLTSIENTSYYQFKIQDVTSGVNISYFVECSDVLQNVGSTSVSWVIVEPKFDDFGEEVLTLAETNKTVYSNVEIDSTGSYKFILSGPSDLENITVLLKNIDSNTTVNPIQTSFINISSTYVHKIFHFDLHPSDHAVTLSFLHGLGNFVYSYVWVNLEQPTNNRFTGEMTEIIRVSGIQWEGTNGTYFSFDNDLSSPLVLRAEIYNSEWELISTFNVGQSFQITVNDTYIILVWATLRTGEFTLELTEDAPTTSYDPYYQGVSATSFPDTLFALFSIGILTIIIKKRYRK